MATLRSTKVLTRFFLPTSISALPYHLMLCMAKTLWLSDEGTLPSPSATCHPPTGQTYTPATDTTPPGSRYDVSAKSCDLGASGRCPVTATFIKGQYVPNIFHIMEIYGFYARGLPNFFWSTPASTGEPPPRITVPGLTKLVKFFWSTPACSTGEPPPRFTLPTAISSTDMGWTSDSQQRQFPVYFVKIQDKRSRSQCFY